MSKDAWEGFPYNEVEGRPFVLYEIPQNTEGVISQVTVTNGYVKFYAAGAESDDPVAGCATNWGSWRQGADGTVSIHIPMVGTLIIDPA